MCSNWQVRGVNITVRVCLSAHTRTNDDDDDDDDDRPVYALVLHQT